ncbi:sensor histidine kinase [Dyadobacter alkalitolerans]|uniref:sensor histidine kinase n=1 Tax=Dyadobacter alkalitolerans TaxID=492736 RepID=UPI0012F9276E|nr:HAMP domain-containing sensor histidine kinase [Dyadobacter alkalitolerans]
MNFFKSTPRFKTIWQYLVGAGDGLPLQTRIYHFMCIATIAVMIYVMFFSIAVGMAEYALITGLLIPLQVFLFYLSRFMRRTLLSINIYILIIHGFFVVSYRLSAGISGSTLLSFCIAFFLFVTILPTRKYLVLTLVNLGTVAMLLAAEYNDPTFILAGYTGRKEHFIDIASTYAVTIILILAGLGYIIKHYTIEKDNAEERALMLDDLHEEKARLISVISHDYHTPLTALGHYLSILERHDLSPDQRQAFTAQMRQSVADTQSLLANLLDMTKKSNGSSASDPGTVFSVFEALSGTLKVYGDIARLNGQQINISIPENLEIYTDKQLFTVIIRNLINNAVKFSGEGSMIHFSYRQQKDMHVFAVTDNGPGINEHVRSQILESWQHPARNVSRSGAIGLVLSKKNAEALKADLSFETGQQKGTCFTLKIPVEINSTVNTNKGNTHNIAPGLA